MKYSVIKNGNLDSGVLVTLDGQDVVVSEKRLLGLSRNCKLKISAGLLNKRMAGGYEDYPIRVSASREGQVLLALSQGGFACIDVTSGVCVRKDSFVCCEASVDPVEFLLSGNFLISQGSGKMIISPSSPFFKLRVPYGEEIFVLRDSIVVWEGKQIESLKQALVKLDDSMSVILSEANSDGGMVWFMNFAEVEG
ncbi:MAG: AIM24 family protein [Thermoproteota archaeon]